MEKEGDEKAKAFLNDLDELRVGLKGVLEKRKKKRRKSGSQKIMMQFFFFTRNEKKKRNKN